MGRVLGAFDLSKISSNTKGKCVKRQNEGTKKIFSGWASDGTFEKCCLKRDFKDFS